MLQKKVRVLKSPASVQEVKATRREYEDLKPKRILTRKHSHRVARGFRVKLSIWVCVPYF